MLKILFGDQIKGLYQDGTLVATFDKFDTLDYVRGQAIVRGADGDTLVEEYIDVKRIEDLPTELSSTDSSDSNDVPVDEVHDDPGSERRVDGEGDSAPTEAPTAKPTRKSGGKKPAGKKAKG